ncbi:NF038143 family protein [Chloroflexota bacterium]
MPDEYALILSAEESFARTVAIGVRVRRPVSAWHFLIPGMFLIDYMRMGGEIRAYSKLFLFPRKLALEAAQDIRNGEDRQQTTTRIEEETKEWLISLKRYSLRLHQEQMKSMNLFIDHYSRLLDAEGNSYYSLVRNAYGTRENYQAYLGQLASVEKELDRAIIEITGEADGVRERMQAEQAQVEELRKKEINKIFGEEA